MTKVIQEADLPFSCKELFNAVADFEKFPQIFPTIRTAKIVAQGTGSKDVEMAFKVPPAISAFLSSTSQTVRATTTPDSDIKLHSIGGALKSMDIHWTFNEVAPGKTHVTFEMDYDTGMSAAVNGTVKIFINRSTKDIMAHLADHVRAQAPKGPTTPNP
ncbi:MAG: type II toxin-antitoxin system RatA family toxin [Alphaproteobacteria bacterium]